MTETLVTLPNLRRFKNGEFSKYTRTVIELSKEEDLIAMELSMYVDTLTTTYNDFKTVYKKNRGSILTPELATLDRYRDNGLKLLLRIPKLIADFGREENDRKLANIILKVITKHGSDIYDMAYNQQGGIMDEIIEEVEENKEVGNAVDALNLRKYFNEMKEAHQSFDSIYKSRIKEQQQGQSELSITELRKITATSLRELFDWIFIHAKTKGLAQFETYIGNLNALTDQYNLSVERRLNNKNTTNEALDDDFDPSQGE